MFTYRRTISHGFKIWGKGTSGFGSVLCVGRLLELRYWNLYCIVFSKHICQIQIYKTRLLTSDITGSSYTRVQKKLI